MMNDAMKRILMDIGFNPEMFMMQHCDCGDKCECTSEDNCGCGMPEQKQSGKVYGFSMSLGPDGIPRIREFGNMPSPLTGMMPGVSSQMDKADSKSKSKFQTNIDIIENVNNTGGKIIAEMPGVEKTDFKITARKHDLYITAHNDCHDYNEKVIIPGYVDNKTIKATYKNGVLEVTFEYDKRIDSNDIKVE